MAEFDYNMPCLTPLVLKRESRNYKGDFTNVVPCGLCPHCKQQRSYHWQFRLKMEQKTSTSSCFLTLTYETAPITKYQNLTLQKTDLQKFFKRLRKKLPNTKIKYYAIGEYGSRTYRPHYHAIMFNLPQQWLEDPILLQKIWTHGIVQIDKAQGGSIAYVCNYITTDNSKIKELADVQQEFSIMSKKMGLNHLTPQMLKHYRENLSDTITHSGGQKSVLPRYLKEKIFTKKEMEIITAKHKEHSKDVFQDRFNNSFKDELTWKKDQYRKQEKNQFLKSLNL